MNTFTIEFKSLTCGPCASQGEWFKWETYPISDDVNGLLRTLRARYRDYEWRA